MKIGILTSSPDNLYLFHFLHEYNFSYHIWYDQEGGHRGDKTTEFVQKRLELGFDYLIAQGVDKCILPPSRELVFLGIEKYKEYVLPLFSDYISQQVLPGSRIGKIGLVGDWSDLQKQDALKQLSMTYALTENQQSTQKFHSPFAYWSKETPLRKHFLISLGRKDRMMHNVVKHDLRYFTDAGVDTLIPLDYGYFAYDVTIAKFFFKKKCRWHGIKKLAGVFANLVKDYKQTEYAVSISHTGTLAHLQAEKKWMWLLQKGKSVQLKIESMA